MVNDVHFLHDECGAVSLDWAALTAGVVAFSLLAVATMYAPVASLATTADTTLSSGSIISRSFSPKGGLIAHELPLEGYSLDTTQTCSEPWAAALSDCKGLGMRADCRTFEMRDGSRLQHCHVRDSHLVGFSSDVYLNEFGDVVTPPRNAEAF